MREHQGMQELRAVIAREIREAVRDGIIAPAEAPAVLVASLAAMVGAVQDDRRRSGFVRDFVSAFPEQVEFVHGAYGRIAGRC